MCVWYVCARIIEYTSWYAWYSLPASTAIVRDLGLLGLLVFSRQQLISFRDIRVIRVLPAPTDIIRDIRDIRVRPAQLILLELLGLLGLQGILR
jgi:hypothetical protein